MTDWNEPGWELAPLAEGTGPFCRKDFLRIVAGADGGRPIVVADDAGLLPLVAVADEVRFMGDPEITDYHSPLGEGVESLLAGFLAASEAREAVFDSLPDEAAAVVEQGCRAAGWATTSEEHEAAAVLTLPATFDDFLEMIGKKERHEVRRKRRRYERMVGETGHETQRGEGWAFEEFIRLHRMAPGDKGAFLTDEREDLFRQLASLEGWRIDLLRTPDDKAAAVVFGFSDSTGYYLYNSAYDPDLGGASPGVVLLGSMIEMAIEEGLGRFDFLKGDESYKFRLGAESRPLHRIVARAGEGA